MATIVGIILGVLITYIIVIPMWYSRLNIGKLLGKHGKYKIYEKTIHYGCYNKTFYFSKICVEKFLGLIPIWITYKNSSGELQYKDYNLLRTELEETWRVYKDYDYQLIEKFSDVLYNWSYEEKYSKTKFLEQHTLRD